MARRAVAIGVAFTVIAAGAVAFLLLGPHPEVKKSPADEPVVGPGIVSHNKTGLLDQVPAEFAELNVTLRPLRQDGREPTMGVLANGTLFVTGGTAAVWRSLDQGMNWSDVSKRASPRVDEDPYLWVDPLTNRVYSVPNQISCSDLRWSDDGGESWNKTRFPLVPLGLPTEEPGAWGGCGDGNHDHQSLITGPPPAGTKLTSYPNMVYYAYNDRVPEARASTHPGAWMSRSLDGGTTFEMQSHQMFPSDCQLGLSGVPAVSPNGTLYVAKPGCNGVRIGVSYDGGKNWTITDLNQHGMGGGSTTTVGSPTYSTNPAVAVDRAGNAYVLWAGDDGLLHLAHSTDGGVNWNGNDSVVATPPGLNLTAFGAIVAGESGRIAFSYLATPTNATGQSKDAHFAPAAAAWHLYTAWSLDALSADPVFTTMRTTPADDPVHRGPIWQAGDAGSETGNRQLGDFLGMARLRGNPYVAYADSCNKCPSQPESTAKLWVAIPTGAPSLDRSA